MIVRRRKRRGRSCSVARRFGDRRLAGAGAPSDVDGYGTRTNLGTGVWALAITRPDGWVYLDLVRSKPMDPELGVP